MSSASLILMTSTKAFAVNSPASKTVQQDVEETLCDILLIYDNIHCVPSHVKSISVISLSYPCSVLLLGQSGLKQPSWILLLLSPSTCFVVGLCVVL